MFPQLDRVYVNQRARKELGWRPRHDFGQVLRCLAEGTDPRSELSLAGGQGLITGKAPGSTWFAESLSPVRVA